MCRTHTPAQTPAKRSPVQKAARRAQQAAFLEAFSTYGTVTGACQQAGIGRRTHYDWLAQDAEYRAAFEDSSEKSIDRLEQEARRRALVGVDKPVFYKGEKVGSVREYSDTLLIFLLNGRRSEVFKQRHEHTGKDGGPIQSAVTFYLPDNRRGITDGTDGSR